MEYGTDVLKALSAMVFAPLMAVAPPPTVMAIVIPITATPVRTSVPVTVRIAVVAVIGVRIAVGIVITIVRVRRIRIPVTWCYIDSEPVGGYRNPPCRGLRRVHISEKRQRYQRKTCEEYHSLFHLPHLRPAEVSTNNKCTHYQTILQPR